MAVLSGFGMRMRTGPGILYIYTPNHDSLTLVCSGILLFPQRRQWYLGLLLQPLEQ